MGQSSSDAGYEAYLSEQADKALEQAVDEAQGLATELTTRWSDDPLNPLVGASLTIGGDDQPLFVFSIDVDLADDLAADEYPMEDIRQLATELRGRVAETTVDDWSWLVDVGTKARRAYA